MTGGDKFRIDPEAVKGQAPAFGQLAAELKAGFGQLMQSMDTYGECWGRDEYGAAFAKNYTGKASEALGAIQAAVALFEHMGAASKTTADTASQTDQASRDAMRTILNNDKNGRT